MKVQHRISMRLTEEQIKKQLEQFHSLIGDIWVVKITRVINGDWITDDEYYDNEQEANKRWYDEDNASIIVDKPVKVKFKI